MTHSADHRQLGVRPGAGAPYRAAPGAYQPANLADLLERVLDKGIVIAGDITLSLGTVEVLTLKIRLLIASVDKAQEIGINWWQSDPALSSQARRLEEERDRLKERVDRLEARLAGDGDAAAQPRPRRPAERLAPAPQPSEPAPREQSGRPRRSAPGGTRARRPSRGSAPPA